MAQRRFVRDIGVVLAAKLVLLCGLYFLFFDSDHVPPGDARAVSQRVLGEPGR
jgi:hypothetical protein